MKRLLEILGIAQNADCESALTGHSVSLPHFGYLVEIGREFLVGQFVQRGRVEVEEVREGGQKGD
jgi:hypothetical protein